MEKKDNGEEGKPKNRKEMKNFRLNLTVSVFKKNGGF